MAKSAVSAAGAGSATSTAENHACPGCGTLNGAAVAFCKQCGSSLTAETAGAVGAAASAASLPQGRVSCSQCGQPTPSGFTFCQHCGHRLTGEREAPAARAPGRPSRGDIPSLEVPPPTVARAASGHASAHAPAYSPAPLTSEAARPMAAVRPSGGALKGRLIVMRRDGSDGEAITLSGELFDIGRAATGKNFPDDPFLATRHVRFLVNAGGVRVRPLDQVNGVFMQLREPYELQPGDVFYIGRELLRYEQLPPEERDPAPAVEHGVRVFGSTPRESWARLRQLTTAALVRDIWHLSRAEVLLGREEGDIVFPDDEFMSRRHALISRVGGRVRLEDQHSSNGTYVRLRGDRDVQPNDVLRVGDQVLRYEP